jgi:hypothetical protein
MLVLGDVIYELADQIMRDLLRALGMRDLGMPDLRETMKQISEWPMWLAVLVIGVGPGINEELWCRGFLGRGLVARYGFAVGTLLTSLFFGLLHVSPPHVAAAFVMGLMLHFVYLTTRSLWVPILLHFLNNSLSVVLSSKQFQRDGAFDALDQFSKENPLPFVAAAVFLLAAVGWALYQSRARLVAAHEGSAPSEASVEITRVPPLQGHEPWQPAFAGVEYPPPQSGTVVIHPRPGRAAMLLVLIAVVNFAAVIALALAQN